MLIVVSILPEVKVHKRNFWEIPRSRHKAISPQIRNIDCKKFRYETVEKDQRLKVLIGNTGLGPLAHQTPTELESRKASQEAQCNRKCEDIQ